MSFLKGNKALDKEQDDILKMSLLNLPNELLNGIASHLSVSDCIDLSCCNWGLRQALLSRIFRTLAFNPTWWESDAQFKDLPRCILQKVDDRMMAFRFLEDEVEVESNIHKRHSVDDELAFQVYRLFETLNVCPAFDLSFTEERLLVLDILDPADPSHDLFLHLLRAACSSPSVIKDIMVQTPSIRGPFLKDLSDRTRFLDKLHIRSSASPPILTTSATIKDMEFGAKELILEGRGHLCELPIDLMVEGCQGSLQTLKLDSFIFFQPFSIPRCSASKLTSLSITNMLQHSSFDAISQILGYFSPCPIEDFTFFPDGTKHMDVFKNSFATKAVIQCLYSLRIQDRPWKSLERLNIADVRLEDDLTKTSLLALTKDGVTVRSNRGHGGWMRVSCSDGDSAPKKPTPDRGSRSLGSIMESCWKSLCQLLPWWRLTQVDFIASGAVECHDGGKIAV
ncbi:hypothetical protein BT69DRAFT_1369132 [Atractiella rhizophila]|nr:hypothetical protein BT69DRAFT_1369132 [Atractiella rhizophila]